MLENLRISTLPLKHTVYRHADALFAFLPVFRGGVSDIPSHTSATPTDNSSLCGIIVFQQHTTAPAFRRPLMTDQHHAAAHHATGAGAPRWTHRGLVLSSRSELQQVLERRKRVQSNQDEGELSRTPLEDMLLKRQQKQLQKEKEEDEATRGEAQLLEFFRVRQNLRKIQSNVSNKVANSALES
ncbi:Protein FAM107B [Oryzias melastigma]|uniref:Protein FAM107B n=1 Tax=Oryzias melastigma TaxID=30732 RepID=A0A834CSL1_ORYME|nr:Protein FAM107B [Oryzias melastigma]